MNLEAFAPPQGRRAVAALLFAFGLLVVAGAGCGKKEGPSHPGALPADRDLSTENTAETVGQGNIRMPPGREFSVFVAPSSPSRIAPPSVSVKSPPGQGAEILSVKWLVNGAETDGGPLLAPSRFRRGDRIQAAAKLRVSGGGEILLTTTEVFAVNALPAVTDVRIEPLSPITGSQVRAIVQAQDPDGDPLTFKYQWYVDNIIVPGGDSFILKGVKKGSLVHVAVIPNDGFADGAWKYSPRYQVLNALPVVKNQPPKTVPPTRILVHTIVAEDPDGDPLTYTLVKGPRGMVLSGATLTWEVSDQDLDKPAEVVIRISDNDGASTVLTMILNPRKP